MAEAAAGDLRQASLEDALRLAHPCAERESPKYEKAAMRWLERYITEASPTLRNFAKVVRNLEQRALDE